MRVQLKKNNKRITCFVPRDGGMTFIDENDAVLVAAGVCRDEKLLEIVLEEGDRLVGIRSRLYNNDNNSGTRHCKMVFVIGRME